LRNTHLLEPKVNLGRKASGGEHTKKRKFTKGRNIQDVAQCTPDKKKMRTFWHPVRRKEIGDPFRKPVSEDAGIRRNNRSTVTSRASNLAEEMFLKGLKNLKKQWAIKQKETKRNKNGDSPIIKGEGKLEQGEADPVHAGKSLPSEA